MVTAACTAGSYSTCCLEVVAQLLYRLRCVQGLFIDVTASRKVAELGR
jgi:hypothetical protein